MKNRLTSQSIFAISAILTFASTQVFAAGFEKALFWDAHYAGIAGAAQSSVVGPQALYWNPAGLAATPGLQVNGDFSPTLAKFNGNVPNATGLATQTAPFSTAVSSHTGFDPVGAAFVSYGVTDKWSAAIGYYVVGGTKAVYDNVNVNFPAVSYNPPLQANVALTELSVGTGYEVLPGLRIGGAYRILFAKADLSDVTASSTGGVQSYQFNGLSATGYNGFRLGAEYAPADSQWGLGVTWRNRMNVSANTSNATYVQAAPAASGGNPAGQNFGGNSGTVGLNLPFRVDAAAHYAFMPGWTGFLGYSFTNLSQDAAISEEIDNTSAPALAGGATQTNTIPLGWHNQHNIRLALDYAGITDWNFRGGYVWTNQVTPNNSALPILAAPGTGNTFVLGAGHKISSNLSVDGALEFDRDSGTVAASDGPNSRTGLGDYSAKDYVLHLSATLAL